MRSIAPTLVFREDDDKKTMRELVQLFVEAAPNKETMFMQTFGGDGPSDPFLKGIIDRDKK